MQSTIAGYETCEVLYESATSLVFRTLAVESRPRVILKLLKQRFPSPQELIRYRQEFEITRKLDSPGVIKVHGLEEHQGTLVMLVEDFGAESLSRWRRNHSLGLETFLSLALRIAEALRDIHSDSIIHKDINPSNIVWNSETDELKIIDFGISTLLSQVNPVAGSPESLEGTLAYLSPEQTGRMNRIVDYRSDFYSLGVTYYELLTGQLPFPSEDGLAVLHGHIAQLPVAPNQLDPSVPEAVSAIIMKLMSKRAEDRYQSTRGLCVDLQRCLLELQERGQIDSFALAGQDFSESLQISQKLYGREGEVQSLMDSFGRVASGKSEAVLVAGYSGIGKSSLIHEIHRPILEHRGVFVSGKFDQYKRNIPYAAITQAFGGLIRQLLAESQERLEYWREQLCAALGTNGQVIIDVIPELELLIGPHEPVPKMGPTENQNRFNRLFQDFIQVFTQKVHPLALFLDDLQWADAASLHLLEILFRDTGPHYLLFLGAYRDNEVDSSHPLHATLGTLHRAGTELQILTLRPLAEEHLCELLVDTLETSPDRVRTLCEVVMTKTGGNPFFVNQFLSSLYDARLLRFDPQAMEWEWSIDDLEALNITENVVDLMTRKVAELPAATQEVLRLGSCVGNTFELRTLATAAGLSLLQASRAVWPALKAGLLLPEGGADQPLQQLGALMEDDLVYADSAASIRFLHDRVQQAAYSLIPEAERAATHLMIGRLFLENAGAGELEESLFEIVNHLNQGRLLIRSEEERRKLAELNLCAARRAKLSSAYGPALRYITTGIDNLPSDAWEREPRLTLAYFLEKGEIEYLNASWDDALATFDGALAHTRDVLDRCAINEYKSTLYRMKNDLRRSLEIALEALAELGVDLKTFPDEADVSRELERARRLVARTDWEAVEALPEMRDPPKLAEMALLRECFAPAYFLGSGLISIIGIRMTEITIEHGNSLHSAAGYIFFAAITLSSDLTDFDSAYRVGQLSLALNERRNDERADDALLLDMWGTFVCHYKEPINNAREHLMRGYRIGVEDGSYQWAGYCAIIDLFMSFWGPDTLGSVAEKIDTILPGLEKVDPNMVEYYHAIRAAIHNLTHETDDRCRLSEAIWLNARKVEKVSREQDDFVTLLLVTTCNLALANWFGEHERAAAIAESGEKFVAGARGFFLDPVFRFHQCLAYCSAYDSADADAQRNYLETIEATVRRFEHLAEHCPSTYLHQANLCKAELARIRSDIVEAMNLYDEAIASARAGGFVQNDALANEMAARFWSSLNMDKISRLYFTEAAYRYRHWGASQKVAMLENRYGTDLSTSTLVSQSVAGTEAVATAMAPVDEKGLDLSSDSLDLASVAKAMRAICSEIDLGKVLSQIMKVTIENAGAERGVLLLEDGGELQVAATGPHELGSAESSTAISAAIVNYVRRTGERVVLDDATLDDRFRMDPHVIEHRPRSILCLPVVKQTRAIGILYLENNLVTHALTTQRLQALEILAAQAAIAVENARVYEALRVEVIERERRERRFRDLLESAPDATVIVNLNGEIVLANTQAEKIFGYKQSELLGQQIEMLVPDRFKDHELQRERLIDGIDVQPIDMAFESWGLHKDGREFPAEISLGPIDTDDGLVVSASIRDITDRKQLEEQLQQSQKMEAVGQLSGGIAHDFNNILSGILGFAELMKAEIPETGSLRDYTDEIISCSLRAADLTKQLLAFSRKQVVQPKLVDVNEALTSFQGILRRVIREDVELTMTLGEGATTVRIDPGQLEQVVMNLVINARDAIHQAGEIHIRTSLFELIESAHSPVDAMLSGRYLRLEVADSGCGMTPEIQARIFEPFYTTKEMGSGTGLGLATVFGIVQQAHGFIEVDSNAGEGSMFAVYLPWREGEVESLQSVSSAGTPAKRSGTILLVEDDDTLRRYATAALTSSGYQVLPTDGAEEAIALIDRYPNRIDLLLTDVVMPHMSGGELAEYLSEQRPTMKVLFMSGYSEDALVEHRISGEGASLLHKPFTPQQLENAIQEALREPR